MRQDMQPQILNAASSLLGIALVIIAGLHVSRASETTMADEVAWGAAVALALSCILSYRAIRLNRDTWMSIWADRIFMVGLLALFGAIVVLALGNH